MNLLVGVYRASSILCQFSFGKDLNQDLGFMFWVQMFILLFPSLSKTDHCRVSGVLAETVSGDPWFVEGRLRPTGVPASPTSVTPVVCGHVGQGLGFGDLQGEPESSFLTLQSGTTPGDSAPQ